MLQFLNFMLFTFLQKAGWGDPETSASHPHFEFLLQNCIKKLCQFCAAVWDMVGQNWKHDDWSLKLHAAKTGTQEAYSDGTKASVLRLDARHFVFLCYVEKQRKPQGWHTPNLAGELISIGFDYCRNEWLYVQCWKEPGRTHLQHLKSSI